MSLDNQDFLSALILDLYTLETGGTVTIATTVLQVQQDTQSTTSTTFVAVTSSAVAFTPSKANFKATCHNISANNNGANRSYFELRFNGAAGDVSAQASVLNTAIRELSVAAIFENVDIGIEHNLEIYFRAAAGTAAIGNSASLVYEIVEYD